MPPRSKTFHRSEDGLIGGVCAGIAEHFDSDAMPIRLLAVIFALATFGIGAVVYLILMACWPMGPAEGAVREVDSGRVDSLAFGTLSRADIKRMRTDRRARADAPLQVGHTPPVPPDCYVRVYGIEDVPYFQYRQAAAEGPTVWGADATQPPNGNRVRLQALIVILVTVTAFLLAVLTVYAMAGFTDELGWRQCLPLFFMLLGLALVLIPLEGYPLYARAAFGLALLILGAFLLDISIGVLSAEEVAAPPVLVCLVLMAVFSIIAFRRRDREGYGLLFAAVIAFGFVAFVFCAVPGTLDEVQVNIPALGSFIVHVNPWL